MLARHVARLKKWTNLTSKMPHRLLSFDNKPIVHHYSPPLLPVLLTSPQPDLSQRPKSMRFQPCSQAVCAMCEAVATLTRVVCVVE